MKPFDWVLASISLIQILRGVATIPDAMRLSGAYHEAAMRTILRHWAIWGGVPALIILWRVYG